MKYIIKNQDHTLVELTSITEMYSKLKISLALNGDLVFEGSKDDIKEAVDNIMDDCSGESYFDNYRGEK